MSTKERTTGVTDAIPDAKVHLLDIGSGKAHRYGDCLLCQFGDVSVLIDGGHPSDDELVMDQLRELLGQPGTVTVSLIIITHPHDDHIGCIPDLVAQNRLKAKWALVCDPQYRWGNAGDTDANFAGLDARVRGIVEAALEHDRTDWDDDELVGFIDSTGTLEPRYRALLDKLRNDQTRVVLHGTDAQAETELLKDFASVGLEVLGPSLEHLKECRRLLAGGQTDAIRSFDFKSDLDLNSAASVANAYRNLVVGVTDAPSGARGAINLQSLVTCFTYKKQRFIFAGDMQFADPQVSSQMLKDGVTEMRQRIRARAPYAFVKLSHHGSLNAFDTKTMPDYGKSTLFGISCGDAPGNHPNRSVLALLDNNRDTVDWVRSDRNGLVSITFNAGGPTFELSRGKKDDATRPKPTPQRDMFTDAEAVRAGADAPVSTDGGSDFTFTAKVPANATRLSVTLDLQPGGTQSAPASPVAVSATADFAEALEEVHEAGDVPQDELTPNSADDIESEPGSAAVLTIDANCDVRWRVAKSLLKLRDQVNARAPRRNKASDGTIGDTAHCQRNSDHNPWVRDGSIGVVTAMDITNDPARGCDVNTIAEAIRASRDSRVKYIIWNRRIANSAAIGSAEPWQWRPYSGTNPHTKHVHISVKPDKASYDSTATWSI